MTAASPAVSAAVPVAIVAEPIHDRTWWTEESARVRTGWPVVIDAALEIMVAAGIIRPEQSTFELACEQADRKRQPHPSRQEVAMGAPATTVEALVFSLGRGVNELTQPDTERRLAALDAHQLKEACRRVQASTRRLPSNGLPTMSSGSDRKRAMTKISHSMTSDSPGGQPWPPADSSALWVIVRRANGCTLWRAIQLVYPPVADIAKGRAVQTSGLPGPPAPSSSIHRNSGTTPDAAGRFAGHDMTGVPLMKKSELFPSEHYNSGDVKIGAILLTVSHVRKEPVGNGTNTSDKFVVYFREPNSKKLVLTPTKFDAIAMIAKSDDTENWEGVQIVLELGKANYQGKLVDSVAIRAPRRPNKMAAPAAPITRPPTIEADLDDEIPY